jgi:hypothetical protein
MAVLSPVKNLAGNHFAVIVATMLLIPSLMLFWFIHASPQLPCVVQRVPVHISDTDPGRPCQYCTSVRPCAKHSPSYVASLVQQQAEQNTPAVAQNVEQLLWPDFGAYNDTYDGFEFWGDDIVSNLFSNLGQLCFKYSNQIWMALATIGLFGLWIRSRIRSAKS